MLKYHKCYHEQVSLATINTPAEFKVVLNLLSEEFRAFQLTEFLDMLRTCI